MQLSLVFTDGHKIKAGPVFGKIDNDTAALSLDTDILCATYKHLGSARVIYLKRHNLFQSLTIF